MRSRIIIIIIIQHKIIKSSSSRELVRTPIKERKQIGNHLAHDRTNINIIITPCLDIVVVVVVVVAVVVVVVVAVFVVQKDEQ